MKRYPECGSILSEPEKHSCKSCGNACPEKGLVARILYKSGDYLDEHLCSWACVANWLRGVTTDYAIILPVLRFSDVGAFWRAMRIAGDETRCDSGIHAE